jgi:hypothetical protein
MCSADLIRVLMAVRKCSGAMVSQQVAQLKIYMVPNLTRLCTLYVFLSSSVYFVIIMY